MAARNRVYDENMEATPLKLRIFVSTDHDRHMEHRKRSSVVLARDEIHARELLDAALIREGLRPYKMWRYQMQEIPTNRPFAEVLNDGDY